MDQKKVGASRHNAKAAPGNNPSSGSNRPEPPSLIGGGGSTNLNNLNSSKLVGTPPPIKRERDSCYSGQPCGDLWNTHPNLGDLRRHLHYLFGISWKAISRIIGDYGVDHINQNIHETREMVRQELQAGRPIKKSLAHCFMYCMDGIRDAEPELSPEAAAERDVTQARGLNLLKPKKKDERQKHLEDRERKDRR